MGLLDRQGFLLGNLIKRVLFRGKGDGEKILVGHAGELDEFNSGMERRKHVRFPVSLAVRHGQECPLLHQDFVLNASEGGVFVQCDTPFPPGTILVLHFYVPPEERLLAEFSGEVTDISTAGGHPSGMHIKFFHYSDEHMERFMAYLEESRSLLDIQA
jgi:hypothetical protein